MGRMILGEQKTKKKMILKLAAKGGGGVQDYWVYQIDV
jgi:hypothetical protein